MSGKNIVEVVVKSDGVTQKMYLRGISLLSNQTLLLDVSPHLHHASDVFNTILVSAHFSKRALLFVVGVALSGNVDDSIKARINDTDNGFPAKITNNGGRQYTVDTMTDKAYFMKWNAADVNGDTMKQERVRPLLPRRFMLRLPLQSIECEVGTDALGAFLRLNPEAADAIIEACRAIEEAHNATPSSD